jgi:uncharacterized protein YkwD
MMIAPILRNAPGVACPSARVVDVVTPARGTDGFRFGSHSTRSASRLASIFPCVLSACRRWPVSGLAFFAPLLAFIALTASAGLLAPQKAEALDNEEQTFLTQINNYRAQNGLASLTLNDRLADVARWMANDMATHNYFSHEDSLGRDPFQRMGDLGYNTWRGENLVAGAEGATQAFQMWRDSLPHNDNMLGSHYTVIGIGRAYSATSAYGWYWTTEFAGEEVVAAPPPARSAAPAPATTPVPEPALTSAPRTQLVTAAKAPANTPAPIPASTPSPWRITAHSGLVFDGLPPIELGHRTGGSFLSVLLDLAPLVDRVLSPDAVRVVHSPAAAARHIVLSESPNAGKPPLAPRRGGIAFRFKLKLDRVDGA